MRRLIATVALALTLAFACAGASAQTSPPLDWATVGRFLSLLQLFMQSASASAGNDPQAVQRAMDDILTGRNPEANRLMLEMFGDMPPVERDKLMAIGRSMVAMTRKQAAVAAQQSGDETVLRARQALHGMGLAYYDRGQFLDAVKRGDVLAVKLFLTGKGVDAGTADAWGTSALELARRGGNPELIGLLSPTTGK